MGRAEFKVPGGKLLAAETSVDDGCLAKVKITGDFFMHPEEAIEGLEEALSGILTTDASIDEAIEGFFGDRTILLIGASPRDFVHVLRLSLESSPS
jgi:lipoate-protein ligase A